jgi:hypothetical protein
MPQLLHSARHPSSLGLVAGSGLAVTGNEANFDVAATINARLDSTSRCGVQNVDKTSWIQKYL